MSENHSPNWSEFGLAQPPLVPFIISKVNIKESSQKIIVREAIINKN